MQILEDQPDNNAGKGVVTNNGGATMGGGGQASEVLPLQKGG